MRIFHSRKLVARLTIMILACVFLITAYQIFYLSYVDVALERQAEDSAVTSVHRIESTINNNLQSVMRAASLVYSADAFQSYLTEENLWQKVLLKNEAEKILEYVSSTNTDISDLMLVEANGMAVSATQGTERLENLNMLQRQGIAGQISRPVLFTDYAAGQMCFAYAIPVIDGLETRNPDRRLGTFVIVSSFSQIQKVINEECQAEGAVAVVVDAQGRVVVSNKNDLVGEVYNESGLYGGFRQKSITQKVFLENGKWQVVFVSRIPTVWSGSSIFILHMLVLSSSCVLLFLIVYYFVYHNVTSPINKLIQQIQQIGDENLKQRVTFRPPNELGVITDAVNLMLDKMELISRNITYTQNKLYEAELTARQAQISALESSINPHFLYNTLECMKNMGIFYGSNEIVQISEAMADIFRYSIKEEDFVEIRKELYVVDQYLSIMNIRFRDKFIIHKDIPEDLLTIKIPKMILQPIVENAVYHGLEGKQGKGRLDLVLRLEGRNLIFIVQDNGKGISAEQVKEMNQILRKPDVTRAEGMGVGILNVAQKLKLFLNSGCTVEIKSERNKGTQVVLFLQDILS